VGRARTIQEARPAHALAAHGPAPGAAAPYLRRYCIVSSLSRAPPPKGMPGGGLMTRTGPAALGNAPSYGYNDTNDAPRRYSEPARPSEYATTYPPTWQVCGSRAP
jgi:hypothetical protein